MQKLKKEDNKQMGTKSRIELARIVKRDGSWDLFNKQNELIAIFFTEHFLKNVLELVFDHPYLEPIPLSEDVPESALDKVSKALNRGSRKVSERADDKYVKSIVKYTRQTDDKILADAIMWNAKQANIYAEMTAVGKQYVMTAYPYSIEEVKWLKKNDWVIV